jgi:hypothetical protein
MISPRIHLRVAQAEVLAWLVKSAAKKRQTLSEFVRQILMAAYLARNGK